MTLSGICPEGILVEVVPGGGTTARLPRLPRRWGWLSRPVARPGEPFICEPVPLPKAGAACFGKALAGERPKAGPGSSLAALLLPGKGGGWGLGTADGSVRQECLHTKELGAGEAQS